MQLEGPAMMEDEGRSDLLPNIFDDPQVAPFVLLSHDLNSLDLLAYRGACVRFSSECSLTEKQ